MAADLNTIRRKVRRLTRTPSPSHLSDQDIDEYINTFYIYDLPEELRLAALKLTLTFFTEPFKDVYATDSVPGLVGFLQNYITVEQPMYIAGKLCYFSQSREEFFNLYPIISYRPVINGGDGVTTAFSGFIPNVPTVQNSVSFTSIASAPNGEALVIKDQPITGNNISGLLVDQQGNNYGGAFINYITGEYSFNFTLNGVPIAPAFGAPIQAQYLPYKATLPTAILFYGNEFTLRPIPDTAYKVTMNAFVRPTAFNGDPVMTPFLEEWWQYLSYGAAKKIFEDRAELESVENIMPEFIRQQDLILRRTLVQYSAKLPQTIYNMVGYNSLGWNSQSGGNF